MNVFKQLLTRGLYSKENKVFYFVSIKEGVMQYVKGIGGR